MSTTELTEIPTKLTPLNRQEAQELRRLEEVIGAGMRTFVEVGQALVRLRDLRLYRSSHPSFEPYCREKWGMSKTHANRLISSATVVETLGNAAVKPLNESQVRPLAALPPERQADAWATALKGSKGKVTAAHVQAVVDDMLHASDGKSRPKTTSIRWVDRTRLVTDLKQFCTRHELRLPEAVWKYLQNY